MTIGELAKIVEEHNIPADATMLSDSEWECSPTDMDGIYYNKRYNELMFTQTGDKYDDYYGDDEWELLHSGEEEV